MPASPDAALAALEEKPLFDRARGGDRSAVEEVLRRYEKRIYRFGLRLCGNEDSAKDVLQQTMLTLFEQLPNFRGESAPSTWIYALARSACSRQHRRTRSAPLHDLDLDIVTDNEAAPLELMDTAPLPETRTATNELAEAVSAALSTLPDAAKEVIVLRDVEQLPVEEAAEVLGLHVNAFKSRLHRARQGLQLSLASILREEGEVGGERPCEALRGELTDLRAQPVDRSLCARIEAHIDGCTECQARLGPLRAAAQLCRRLPGDDVPQPVRRAVRHALKLAAD